MLDNFPAFRLVQQHHLANEAYPLPLDFYPLAMSQLSSRPLCLKDRVDVFDKSRFVHARQQ